MPINSPTENDRAVSGCSGAASSERGTVLIMILLALLAVGLMSMVLAQIASTELAIASNLTAGTVVFLPADGASQVLLRDLVEMSRSLGRFPTDAELDTIQPPTLTNITLTEFDAFADGAPYDSTLSSGLYIGLSASIQPFKVIVTADSPGPPASQATVEIEGEFATIPIYQFGVLYEGDLDVHPGPVMAITGRVHSNANLWIDPGNQVSFDHTVTANGNIYNTHEEGSTSGGIVPIMDATATYQNMDGLDSDDPNWSSEAIDRWDGRVRSGEIGGDRLDLVIEDPTDPRLIIEAGLSTDTSAEQAAKIWYDAELRIVNGRGYDSGGTPVSLVDPITATSAVRYTVLYDWREQKYILTTEVDVEKLSRATGYPVNPDNSALVYFGAFEPGAEFPLWPGASPGVGPAEWAAFLPPWSTDATEFAFKVTNGDTLDGPLTMVTENPMYMHGSFNIVNKKPAAVLADAVTMLSNSWGDTDGDGNFDSDLDYSLLDLSLRNASDTTMNAAFMTGNVDAGINYNGGLENLPRLLESWSGDRLTLLGSLAALWESEYADGAFGASNVYSAAIRDWYFDTDFLDLNNLPPRPPSIYKISVTSWEHR